MSETAAITGGCFCGKVRYEIDPGEYRVVNCHCTMCRRCHAAPFVTWLVVPTRYFRWIRGKPRRLESSTHAWRGFCGDCGTPLSCASTERPDHIDIPTGCLDAPEEFIPKKDIFEDTRLHWL